jgi:hypothetical protein
MNTVKELAGTAIGLQKTALDKSNIPGIIAKI